MELSRKGPSPFLSRIFFILAMWLVWGTVSAHAPMIFYNVPNWYSSGFINIRYPTPYEAFSVEWDKHAFKCQTGALGEVLVSVQIAHSDGYQDGDLYSATEDHYNYDCSYWGKTGYSSGARRWAVCGNSQWGPYNADAYQGRQCPTLAPDPEKGKGGPTCPACKVGDPVNPGTGNKFEVLNLIRGSGQDPLSFTIYYNSGGNAPTLPTNHLDLGNRRVHNFQMRVTVAANDTVATAYVLRPDGKTYGFDRNGDAWVADADVADKLESARDAAGNVTSWTYTRADRTQELYDANGRLLAVQNSEGMTQTLTYDATGHLSALTDAQGRSLVLTWDPSGRIEGIQSPDLQNYQFVYDGSNNLSKVIYPDESTRQYIYGEYDGTTNFAGPSDLTGQVDESGNRIDTTTYGYYYGLVKSTVGAGGTNPTSITTNSNTDQNASVYTVTDGAGVTTTTSVSYMFGVSKPMTVTRTCPGCATQTTTYTYDTNGRVATTTDGNGVVTATTYDASGLLATKVEAQGRPEQRTTVTTWNASLRSPLLQTVSDSTAKVVGKQGWSYNTVGQTTAACLINPVAAPSYTCAASGAAPAGVRRTVFTYCTAVDGATCPLAGLLLSVDGPRADVSDVVSYTYYPATDESGCGTLGGACHHVGDLQAITDGAGLVTSYVAYDRAGRPSRMKSPAGVFTDYTYTPRGWLATKIVRGGAAGTPSASDAVTTIAYDPDGSVHLTKDPDGVTTTFTYDAARRLTDITDGSGQKIHYVLDVAGNRTSEQVLTTAGTVARSTTRTFNALAQLTSIVDGLGRPILSAGTAGSYDAAGNLVTSQDGRGVTKKRTLDGLNRLIGAIRDYQGPDSGTKDSQWKANLDALNRLAGFTDADGLTTTFDVDAFGNTTGAHSPDTGDSTRGFDTTGNRTSFTDALGINTAATYDADDRLLATTYPDTTLNIQYKYDEADSVTGCTGKFGKGHLTRVIENGGGINWCYDNRGNVVKKQQTVETGLRTVTYTWTLANRLKSVTTPNGTLVEYTRNALGQVTSVTATPSGGAATPVVSNVVYTPFGAIASYTLGNGQAVARTYDATGALTDIASPAFSLHMQRDATGNITALLNASDVTAPLESYSYDALGRITAIKDASGTVVESYAYSKTGDRLSKTAPGILTGQYTYQTATHHLTAAGTSIRQVDARGNTTSSTLAGSTYLFGYNQRNRLSSVQKDGVAVASYNLNALGQRVQKVAGGTSTRYDFDETGRFLAEATGALSRDYVWLDGVPVGVVDRTGSAVTVSFITADGLGSPRAVTNAVGVVQWLWPYAGNPFGEKAPASPTGYTLNLRFQGQYFDAESGLSYNQNRDYEAGSGRYVQSDPIGVRGGLTSYGYAYSNPGSNFDPTGLDTCRRIVSIKGMSREELVGSTLVSSGWQLRGVHVEPGPSAGGISILTGGVSTFGTATGALGGKAVVDCHATFVEEYKDTYDIYRDTHYVDLCFDEDTCGHLTPYTESGTDTDLERREVRDRLEDTSDAERTIKSWFADSACLDWMRTLE